MAERVGVEVVLALPDRQLSWRGQLDAGATVRDAVQASGLAAEQGDAVDLSRVGVFGRRVEPDQPLRDGDRVEIYRPLALDPKEARRQRARRP
ncbi:RnfH family protein [Frateuria defendens]|uniref:RnfH family protein n=1 Tax=Frateuria defendens TaxID=2219559 RepID=UPI00066FEF02|nr:RnfH family protein [Frateuria defendens]